MQPTYVRCTAKGKHIQLVLPDEVHASAATAVRSTTTGHLLLKCPRARPLVRGAKPAPEQLEDKGTRARLGLAGAVDIHGIVPDEEAAAEEAAALASEAPPPLEEAVVDDDEDEVPPLE